VTDLLPGFSMVIVGLALLCGCLLCAILIMKGDKS
jgi:hypothetical protein